MPRLLPSNAGPRLACWILAILAVTAAAFAQGPPPVDMNALAEEAEGFARRRQIGAAVIWGGLLVASVLIGWVRFRQRRDARKQQLS